MSPDPSTPERHLDDSDTAANVNRRHVLTVGAGIGTVLLAGCSTGSNPTTGSGDSTTDNDPAESTETTGTFRLLISDRPADIGDFDALNITFDRARIFRGEEDGDDETAEETEPATETGTTTETETGTTTGSETTNGTGTTTGSESTTEVTEEDGKDDDEEERGFFVIDIEGETVDLTQVVGEKAISVFDGELPEGRYSKIELYVADVEGIVDDEPVPVKVPSGKLQIVSPFDVVSGETLSFVFDINVVEKGQTGEYNLLPVIAESGVAGEDVEAEEIEKGEAESEEDDTVETPEGDEENSGGGDAGEPDDSGTDT